QLVSGLSTDDVVVFLISGGGSALFEKPLDPAVTLSDLVEFNRVLVTCGLPIEQINVLRKHISAVKGGRLARSAYPAHQLTVFVSDVPPRFNSMVASGPTMPDDSTLEQCYALALECNLLPRFPPSIQKQFEQATLKETPKPGDSKFHNSSYFCLLSNREAVEAARVAAEKHGFLAEIDSGDWDAGYQQVVRSNLAALDALAARHRGEPVCLVAGGEVICPVTGPGTGGRNQAFVLYAAQQTAGQNRVVLSAGTDGRDGNSPVSGAMADGQTVSRGRDLQLDSADYLARSDSFSYFRALNLTEAGFKLTAFNRTRSKAESLEKAGATIATSAADAAREADVVIIIVSDTAAVEEVVLGKGGVLESVRPASIVMDSSTISP